MPKTKEAKFAFDHVVAAFDNAQSLMAVESTTQLTRNQRIPNQPEAIDFVMDAHGQIKEHMN